MINQYNYFYSYLNLDFNIVYNIINGIGKYKSKLSVFTCGNIKIEKNFNVNINKGLKNGRN
jgi:uncharacterized membrane protein